VADCIEKIEIKSALGRESQFFGFGVLDVLVQEDF
jgi:hypothetical protein